MVLGDSLSLRRDISSTPKRNKTIETLPFAPQTKPSQNIIPLFKHTNFNRILLLYVPLDILSLAVGYILAWALAAWINILLMHRHLSINSLDMKVFTLLSAGVIIWFSSTHHYRLRMPFWAETKAILKTLGFTLLIEGFIRFALQFDFSRIWLVLGWIFAALFIVLSRNLLRSWLRHKNVFQVATLLIGGGETAKYTRAALRSEPSLGYEIIAQTKNLTPAFSQEGKSWKKLCFAYGVQYVIIALDGHEMKDAEQLIAQLTQEGIPFSISPPLRHLPLLGLIPQYFFNHDVLLMTHCNKLEQPFPRYVKRTFDIIAACSLLLVTSPILLCIGLGIKCDGGPALYGHLRVGLNGKVFSCLKFRSMKINGDAILRKHFHENPSAALEWAATRKLKNDPRVTPIGTFIRKSSLDEIPQLINVLRGDMSLVGPRPIVRDEIGNYADDIHHYYTVRPGITGLWQVSGRNNATYTQRVQMDSWYVRNWSLGQDIAILLKTIPAVLKRSGAY